MPLQDLLGAWDENEARKRRLAMEGNPNDWPVRGPGGNRFDAEFDATAPTNALALSSAPPKLFDLPSAMMLQADPSPRAYGFDPLPRPAAPSIADQLGFGSPQELPADVMKFAADNTPASGPVGGVLSGRFGTSPAPAAMAALPQVGGPNPPSLREILSPAPAAVAAAPTPLRDAPAGFTGPPGPVQRTFTGSSGTTSYDMTPGFGAYFGSGNVNGQKFSSLDEVGAARSRASLATGLNETGVAGVPDVRSLSDSLFGGTMIPPDQRRMLAVQSQQKLIEDATRLNAETLRGQFGVQEAEARRKDAINARITDRAALNAQRVRERGGSDEEARQEYDRSLRTEMAALPASVQSALGNVPPPDGNADQTDFEIYNRPLKRIVSEGEYNRGSGQAIIDQIVNAPPSLRQKLVEGMMKTPRDSRATGGRKELRDALAASMAADYLRINPAAISEAQKQTSIFGGESTGLLSPEGLPFQLRVSRGFEPTVTAVLPDGTSIQIPKGHRAGPLGRLFNQEDTDKARRRLENFNPDWMMRLYDLQGGK